MQSKNWFPVSVIHTNKLLVIYVLVNPDITLCGGWLGSKHQHLTVLVWGVSERIYIGNNNNILYYSQWEIKAVVRSYLSLIPTIALILCSLSTDICQLQYHDWDKQTTFFFGMFSSGFPETVGGWLTCIGYTDWPLVEFIYLVFTCMPGESYCSWLRSLFLCLCDVFWELINSLVCWLWCWLLAKLSPVSTPIFCCLSMKVFI